MGMSHKNPTHTTMKTAFLSTQISHSPASPAPASAGPAAGRAAPPAGKRAGRLARARAYYPAQPGRRSRRDTPISSPKDIAGYRPNGPFNTCTSPPPTLAEILRVLLETRLDKAGNVLSKRQILTFGVASKIRTVLGEICGATGVLKIATLCKVVEKRLRVSDLLLLVARGRGGRRKGDASLAWRAQPGARACGKLP